MKTRLLSTLLLTLSFGVLSATASQSATPGKHEMSHDHMMMADEPHHALAMAYCQNMTVFAKALQEQTARASSVDVEFARAAVTEMRRSFEQMKQHHQEHVQAMSAEMQTKLSGMMQQMETHQAELNTQLTALEQEVQAATPDAKKVSTLVASVHTHLDAMSKMMSGSKGSQMKMKM